MRQMRQGALGGRASCAPRGGKTRALRLSAPLVFAAALIAAAEPTALGAETGSPPEAVSECPEVQVPLDVSVGGTPIATLAVGGVRGAFLIDTGATGNAVDAKAFGVAAGSTVELDVPFCGPARVFRAEDMAAYRAPPGGQSGRIGTDILGRVTVVFAYGARPTITIRAKNFDSSALSASGLNEIGPTGRERKHSPVNAVPALRLSIGPVTFPAQLDTGFDDSVDPGVVQANAALLVALEAHGVAMHPVAAARTSGCSGVRVYPRWRIDAAALAVIATNGTRVAYPSPLLEIKDDVSCGGIAAFAEPFAEIGASWLGRWGTTVVDGPSGTVWIQR